MVSIKINMFHALNPTPHVSASARGPSASARGHVNFVILGSMLMSLSLEIEIARHNEATVLRRINRTPNRTHKSGHDLSKVDDIFRH